jgi:hypothetical protein
VATLAGAPRIGQKAIQGEGLLRLGQWLETDAGSRARVEVGSIGEVKLESNSRLRLAGVGAKDHRVELARGTLHALIWAPPRLFFVDTSAARAIDLGCEYTLTVQPDGSGELMVLTGYVALEHGRRESIIPSGMTCLTRAGAGPGTPFVTHASREFRAALTRIDFEHGPVHELLTLVAPQDAVTLWHLVTRTSGAERAAVYDALLRFMPPPAGVTRDGVLGGQAAMWELWAEALALRPLGFR